MKCVGLAVLVVVSTINAWPTEEDLIEGGLQQTAQSEDYGHLEYLPGGDEYSENSQFYAQKDVKSHRRQNSEDFQKSAFVSDHRGLNAEHAGYRSREADNENIRRIHSLNQDQSHVPSGGYQRNIQLEQARSSDQRSFSNHQSNELRTNGGFQQSRSGFQSTKKGREDYRQRSEDQFLQHGVGSDFRDGSAIKSSVESAHRRYNSEDTEAVHQQDFVNSDIINDGFQVPSFIENKKPRPIHYNQKPSGPPAYQRPKTFPSPLLRGGEKQNYGNDFIENEPETYVRETKKFAASHRNTGPTQPRITVLRNGGFVNKGIVTSNHQGREFERSTKEYIDKALKEAEEAKKYAKVIANKLSALKTSFDKDLHKVNVVDFADNSQNFENPTDNGEQVKVVDFADNSNPANLGNDVQDYSTDTGNQNEAPVFQTPYYLPYGKFVNNPRYKDFYPTPVTKPNYGPFLDYPVHIRKGFHPHRVGGGVNVAENADNTQNFANPNQEDDKVKVVESAENSPSLPNLNNDNADEVNVVENAVNNKDQDKVKVVQVAENQDDGQKVNFVNNNPEDVSNNGVNVVDSSANNPNIQGNWNQGHDNSHLLRFKSQSNKPVFQRPYLPHGKFENHPRYKNLYPKPNYGPFLDSQTVPNVNEQNADKVNVVENAGNNNNQDKVKVVDLVISQDDLEKAKSLNDETNNANNGVNVVETPAGNPSNQGIWNQGLDNSHLLRGSKPVNENAATDVLNNGDNVPDFKKHSSYLPNGKFLNHPRFKDLRPTVATKPTFAPIPVQARDSKPLANSNVDDGAPGFMASPSNLNEDSEYPDTVQNAYKSRPKYNGFRPYRPYNKNYLKNGPVVSNSYYRNPPNFLPNQAVNGPTTIVGPATGLQRPDISPVFADVIQLPDGTYAPSKGNNANLLRTDKNAPVNEGIVKPVEEEIPQEIVPTVNEPTSVKGGPITGFETPDISPVFADVIKLPDGTYAPSKGNNANLLRTDKAPESEGIVKPVEDVPQDTTTIDNIKTSAIENSKQDSNPIIVETTNEIVPQNNEPADDKVEPTTIQEDGPKVTDFQQPDISPTFIDVIVQPDGTLTPSQENNGALTNDSKATSNEGSLENIIKKRFAHIPPVPGNENATSTQEKDDINKENASSTNGLSPKSGIAENFQDVSGIEEGFDADFNIDEAGLLNETSTRKKFNRSGVPNGENNDKIVRTFIIETDADGRETTYEEDVVIKGNATKSVSQSPPSSASAASSGAKPAPRSGPVSTDNADETILDEDFNSTDINSTNLNETQDITATGSPNNRLVKRSSEDNTAGKDDKIVRTYVIETDADGREIIKEKDVVIKRNATKSVSQSPSSSASAASSGAKPAPLSGPVSTDNADETIFAKDFNLTDLNSTNLNEAQDITATGSEENGSPNNPLGKGSSEDNTADDTRRRKTFARPSGVSKVGNNGKVVRTFVIETDASGQETIYEIDVVINENPNKNPSQSSTAASSASSNIAKSAPRSGPVSSDNSDSNITEDFNEPPDIMARKSKEKPTQGVAKRKHKRDTPRKNQNLNTGTTESINDESENLVNGLNEDTKVKTKSSENIKVLETNLSDADSAKKGSKDRVKHKKSKRKHRKSNKQNENADNVEHIESTKPNTETVQTNNDKPKTNDNTDISEDVKVNEDQSTISQDSDVSETAKNIKHKGKHSKAKVRKSKNKHSKRNKGKKISSSDDEDTKSDDDINIETTGTDEMEQSSEKSKEAKENETISEDDQTTRVEKVSKDKKVKRKHRKRSKSEKSATSRKHKKDKKSRKHKTKQNIDVTEKDQEETKTIINEETSNDQQGENIKRVDDTAINVKDKTKIDSDTFENSSVTTSDDKADDSKNDDKAVNMDSKKKKPSDVKAEDKKGDEKEVKDDESSNTEKTDDLKSNENGKGLSESQMIRKITRYYKLRLPKRSNPKKTQSNAEKNERSSKSKDTKEKSNDEKSSSNSAKSDNEKTDRTNEESVEENSTKTNSKKHHIRLNAKHHKGKNSKNVKKDDEFKSGTDVKENNDSSTSESQTDVEESNKTKSKKSKHSVSKKHDKIEIDENLTENTEQNDNEENVSEDSEISTREEKQVSKTKESKHSKVHKEKSEKNEVHKTSEKSKTSEHKILKSKSIENSNESESFEQKCDEENDSEYLE